MTYIEIVIIHFGLRINYYIDLVSFVWFDLVSLIMHFSFLKSLYCITLQHISIERIHNIFITFIDLHTERPL